jgi:hypothetical protein
MMRREGRQTWLWLSIMMTMEDFPLMVRGDCSNLESRKPKKQNHDDKIQLNPCAGTGIDTRYVIINGQKNISRY